MVHLELCTLHPRRNVSLSPLVRRSTVVCYNILQIAPEASAFSDAAPMITLRVTVIKKKSLQQVLAFRSHTSIKAY